MKTLEDLKKPLMRNKEFKKHYLAKKPLFEFVHELIALRCEKGWTQEDLAKAAHVPRRLIYQLELGKYDICYSTMYKLTKALSAQLFITAHRDRVVKLSEKAKSALDRIVRYTGKTPEQVIEELLIQYDEHKQDDVRA